MSVTAEPFAVEPAATGPGQAPRQIHWRHWLIGKLLYGSNIDRGAKARARIGLAILTFAALYCIIAARLVMFARRFQQP